MLLSLKKTEIFTLNFIKNKSLIIIIINTNCCSQSKFVILGNLENYKLLFSSILTPNGLGISSFKDY